MCKSNSFIAATIMALFSISAMAQNEASIIEENGTTATTLEQTNQPNQFSSIQMLSIDGGYLDEAKELGYLPYPYGFIQVQGGVGTTLTDVNCFKLLTPTFSIGGGFMFPYVGARLHVNGWKSTGGFDNITDLGNTVKRYKYNYINSNIDLLVNILNIFSPNVSRPYSLYLIGGLGLNYAWHNNEFESLTSQYQVGSNISNAWGSQQKTRHNLFGRNFRAGLLADLNISKNWSVGAEVDFNSLDDRFNSKFTNSSDWMITAQLSITYKFGHSKKFPQFTDDRKDMSEADSNRKFNKGSDSGDGGETAPPTPTVTDQSVKENIFYALRETDINNENIINKVASWCKKYPNKTIVINGYADKGTGNPKINEEYAKLRAEKVAATLREKGVPASQMIVKSFGDTIQPFPENDKNRCVIIEGK